MRAQRGRVAAIVVAASLLMVACGGGDDSESAVGDLSTDTTPSTDTSSTTSSPTVTATTLPTTSTTDDVRREWTNDAVRVWQQFLVDGGATLDIDGFFGPQSEEATKAFQRKNDIPVTGVADPVTLTAAGPAIRNAVWAEMTILTTTTTTERTPQPDDPVVTISCPSTETVTKTQYRAVFGHTESYNAFGRITIDYGDGNDFSSPVEGTGITGAFWHTYDKPGTFVVEVMITDSDGRAASATCSHTWNPN